MAPTMFARSKIEDIDLFNHGEDDKAYRLERDFWSLHQTLTVLAASGYLTFEDLFLRQENPFLLIAGAFDGLKHHRCIEQKRMNRMYDQVATVLFCHYHPRERHGLGRTDIFDLVRTKKEFDSTSYSCPIITYWKDKGKKFNQKFELDTEFDFKAIDLSPLTRHDEDGSDECFRIARISSTVTEIHVLSDNSYYLPDLDD